MKAVRFVIPKTSGNSFRLQIDREPYFYDTIHYHPEHQLTYFIKGEGTSFIGNHVERFKPGDVYFIGKNVPHVSKCDEAYYQNNPDMEALSISLFFNDETFGSQFFEIPEMAHIKRLLELASMGIKITGEEQESISKLIEECQQIDGFKRFQNLLSILDIMAKSENQTTLSGVRYLAPSKESENERINVVFSFLSNSFRTAITLNQIAGVANMTPNAFCRYFKQRTGRPYSLFINEMRVEFAGKMIAGSRESFGNIANESGFNSISYFNRQFKRITGMSPLQYRKKYGQHL
jgi:YesN/AraC family two-component response regulator